MRFFFKASSSSSIYSWSINHVLEHEFFYLGRLAVWAAQGSEEKKVDLSFSEQLLMVVFSTLCGQIFLKILYCPQLKISLNFVLKNLKK